MASGFEVVRLDLAFGRDKLDEWLVAEIDREKFAKLSTFRAGKGKTQTVDSVLAAIEAAAEKRGGDAPDDDDDCDDEPYDHFKMRILGDKLTASGRLTGDAGNEAFLLSAAAALGAELGGKGELLLLGGVADDGGARNLRLTIAKTGWTESALSPAEAAKARADMSGERGLSDGTRRWLSVGAIGLAAVVGVGLAWALGSDRPHRGPKPEPVAAPQVPAVAHIMPIEPPDLPAPTSPSILLVTLDTTRADHLGTYGYFRDTSPTLDALAAESIVFERYTVPMSITLPSHMTVFTSTFPDEHGVVANMAHGGLRFVPSPKLESFTQLAAQEGYVTAGIVSSSPLKKYTGIAVGFQQYYEPSGEARHARETTDLAIEWVEAAPDRPFFLWVHYFDPHWPYNPPARWSDVFHGKDAETQAAWLAARKAVPDDIGLEKVEAKIDKYDAEIRYMDHQIGRLFAALRAKGVWDDLVVVVVGDHGEGLMQHNYPSHGHVWSEQLNAPFLLRIPETKPRRIAEPVSGVDVIPTLLGQIELAGESRFLAQSSGRDALATPAVPVVFRTSEIQHDKATDTKFAKPITWGVTDGEWTCHDTEGEIDLFDHQADPHELIDVSAAHPEIVSRLLAELATRRATQTARGQEFGAGATEEMTAEEKAALEALGYIDGEPDEQAPPRKKAPRTP